MKRGITILFIIGLSISLTNSYCQTKKQTKEWLEYYLNTYFSSTYSSKDFYFYKTTLKSSYSWEEFSYHFNNDKLLISKSIQQNDSSGVPRILKSFFTEIDLKRVIKIEVETDTVLSKSILIKIKFTRSAFDQEGNVINPPFYIYEGNEMNNITPLKSYSPEFHIQSYNEKAIVANLGNRIAKAMEKQVGFCGGKIIEDVF